MTSPMHSPLQSPLQPAMRSPLEFRRRGGGGLSPISASEISDDASLIAEYRISASSLYVDTTGTVAVSAPGDSVGLIVPVNAENGAEIITNGSFDSATGWNVFAGWSVSGGKANATAATGNLQYPTSLTTDRRYVVELDVVVTSGSIQLDIGAAFVNFPITSSGHYTVHLVCGAAPANGLYIRTSTFTGSVDNVSMRPESPWVLYPINDTVRGIYQEDGNGIPYVDMPSGKALKTVAVHTFSAPCFMALALSRGVASSAVVASIGGSGGSIVIQGSTTAYNFIAGSVKSGVYSLPSLRPAISPLETPGVIDVLLTAGHTSVWGNGGSRDVPDDIYLDAGELRTVPNTFDGSESVSSCVFGINYNAGSYTAGSIRFYGGFVYLGEPTESQRKRVTYTLMGDLLLNDLTSATYDIFAIAGQSNAMGVGDQSTSTTPSFGTAIEYIDSGNIKPLKDPTQQAYQGQISMSGSAWPSFAKKYYELTGRKVCISGSAYSGEGLINPGVLGGWLGSDLIVRLKTKLATARQDVKGQVRGVLYLGGEQDASSSFTVASYKSSLVSFRDLLRSETGIADLPLLILSLDNNAANAAQYALIRQAQSEAAAENEGIELVLSYQDYVVGQGLSSDGIHWNQTALNDAGTKTATAVAALFP